MKALFLIFLVACTHFDALRKKPEAPKCNPPKVFYLPAQESYKILFFGDGGTGQEMQSKVAYQMALKDADFGIHLGDIYPSGIQTYNDYISKVLNPYQILPPIFMVLGNHEYLGEPILLHKYASRNIIFPCAYYGIATKLFSIFIFDSEVLTDVQIEQAKVFFSMHEGLKIAAMHHPRYSKGMHGDHKEIQRIMDAIPSIKVYVAGHDHHLEHTKVLDHHFIVSGAAGKSRSVPSKKEGFSYEGFGFVLAQFQREAAFTFYSDQGEELYRFGVPIEGVPE